MANWTEKDLQTYYGNLATPSAPIAPAPPSAKAPRGMNSWESCYAREELEPRRIVGEILWWGFEAIKLRLASATFYTPDFAVLTSQLRLEFHEVKGGLIRDDAIVKFKVAAELFPFRFLMIRKRKVKDGGGWDTIRDLFPTAAPLESPSERDAKITDHEQLG